MSKQYELFDIYMWLFLRKGIGEKFEAVDVFSTKKEKQKI